ncbi:MAG: acyl-CoA dehydrogenase [Betaproteobacteria bacterium]|nr:acyl-CoA dehydrogenase [Betaproteobacteria bacterium]
MPVFSLSEDQVAIQAMAKEFAEGEIRPLAEKLDRSPDPIQDFPWTLVRKGSGLGLRTVALPQEYGGLELDYRTQLVLIDELGYPDVACARIFSQNWKLCAEIADCGTKEQKRKFLSQFIEDETFLLAGTPPASQPESDDALSTGERKISATRKGDHYHLNGTARFASFGPVAKLLLVEARSGAGAKEASLFLVPTDTPGVSVAAFEDTVGSRIDLKGLLVFKDAKLPVANLLGGKEGRTFSDAFIAAGNIEVSAHAMALARAALDATTAYANERIQGGRRIIEHQAVALSLADMYIALQAGRSVLWRAAWELDHGRVDRALTTSCKLFCTEAAINIARNAVELFGGSGVMRELPLQKYFRDALVLAHLGASNGADRIATCAILAAEETGRPGEGRPTESAPKQVLYDSRKLSPIEFEMTEEQRSLQRIAREFSEKEIRPVAEKLDRSENLLGDFPWDLVKKGSKLGLRTLSVPKEYGGPGADFQTWLVVIEELGRIDISLAKIFSQCWKLARRLGESGTQALKDRYLPAFRDDDTFLMSGASTEPGSGSDGHLPYDAPNAGVMLSAQRVGDHYVLNGRKHFVSLAPIAKLLFVTARTDKTVGTSVGTSTFLIPRDTPGLSFGAVHDKVGLRIYFQGEFNFDNAKIPVENLIGGREGFTGFDGAASNIELAAYAVVVARAALDATIRYASETSRGGRPLIRHQSVSAMIADMYQEIEAARTLLWRATWMADQRKSDRTLTMSAKVITTEVAVKVCLSALEIFGEDGIVRASPLQKFARDALALPHMDATNPINKIKIAKLLDAWSAGKTPEWGATTARY